MARRTRAGKQLGALKWTRASANAAAADCLFIRILRTSQYANKMLLSYCSKP
ncbi:hypothetical protein SAMN05444172_2921 [Burkholderia sp. GAS332]|nr:hypothetical protein SAMN05444172_2921 [Burkholderia sp. GAS332]